MEVVPELSHASLLSIRSNLDRVFGENEWVGLDLETMSIVLNVFFDPLLRDKIMLLKVLADDPDLFYQDVQCFLHSVDVCNDLVADFDWVPAPTTLEILYALSEVAKVLGGESLPVSLFSDGVKEAIIRALTDDGFSHVPSGLEGLDETRLNYYPEETNPEDISSRELAIKTYLNYKELGQS